MKHFTFLLLSLLLTCAGTAKAAVLTIDGTTVVTTLDELSANSRSLYIISSEDGNRGALYAVAADMKVGKCGPSTHGGVYNSNKDIAVSATDANQQFALIACNGKYYMYSVGTHAMCTVSADNDNRQVALSTDVAESLTISKTGNYFDLIFGNKKISFSNGGSNYNAVRLNREGEDGWIDSGNKMQLAKVNGATLSDEDYNKAMTIILKNECRAMIAASSAGKVGYPREAACTTLSAAIDAVTTFTAADVTALQSAISTYKSSTDVNMPVSGKAYRIKAKYNSDATPFRYLVYDENDGDLIAFSTTEPTGYNSVFVCRQNEDGTFALVSNSGKFLVYFSDSQNNIGGEKKGFTANYTNGNRQAALTLEHLTTQNLAQPNNVAEQCFGSLSIKGKNASGGNYYLMAGDANFHSDASNLVGFSNNRSSFFYFEEAEYPNTPTLNTATGLEDEPQAIATFSAPFATVVPEGVTAYIVTAAEGETATVGQLAEAGEAIPAGTGVLLYGVAGKATMLPATTETVATVEEQNLLGASAGEAKDMTDAAGAYILGQQNGLTAFYVCTGGTLAANKAYLDLGTESPVKALALNFGQQATGIGAATAGTADTDAPVYDLSGRRVKHTAKGGIYIRNGKKFIVK